jgi:predicted nuclease of predicted toxin-antitoxin system
LRVLIDESLPVELAEELADFDVATVHGQGWLRLRNGVLLRAAVSAGFSVILTADTDLRVRNRIEDLRPLVPKIIAALAVVQPGEAIEVSR